MEYLNLYLKDVLSERPHTRVPSADTVLRGIEELATEKSTIGQHRPKQGLNQTIEKLSADFRDNTKKFCTFVLGNHSDIL